MTFTERDYEPISEGARRSADRLVPIVLDLLREKGYEPTTAVDVGCGEGWWTVALARAGVETLALDGATAGGALELAPPGMVDYLAVDFEEKRPELPSRHVAFCLEVAEHVHPQSADGFVAWLSGLAPVVVFSAAIPGQGGQGHVNEQWPDYWADRFHTVGMFVTGQPRLRVWDDDEIEHWYRQNLLLVWRPGLLRGLVPERPKRLVHPKLWAFHRNVWDSL